MERVPKPLVAMDVYTTHTPRFHVYCVPRVDCSILSQEVDHLRTSDPYSLLKLLLDTRFLINESNQRPQKPWYILVEEQSYVLNAPVWS